MQKITEKALEQKVIGNIVKNFTGQNPYKDCQPRIPAGGDFSVSADKKKNTTVQGLTKNTPDPLAAATPKLKKR
jgi:hypothetical protein